MHILHDFRKGGQWDLFLTSKLLYDPIVSISYLLSTFGKRPYCGVREEIFCYRTSSAIEFLCVFIFITNSEPHPHSL